MRRRVAANRVASLSIAILVALVALTISGVFATTTGATETRSLTSSADTRILENAPNTNYGTVTSLGVHGDAPAGTGKEKSVLLKWDLSTIPAGSKISSASITLNVTNTSAQTHQAYELKRPWVESAATWLLYAAAKSWQIAGAKGSLDKGTTVVGSVSPSTSGKQSFALSPAVVQSWVDNPASNNGIIIAGATNTDRFAFSSRETSTSSLRPQLTLDLSLDTTPPEETTIDSGPSGTVSTSSTSFAFSSSEPNSTFECSLDGGAFASCSSPKSYSGLSEGSHTFQVRAKDAANNVDPTPASYTWTVDTVAPNVSIDSGPSGAVSGTSASFTFSSNDQGATFECSLDGDAFASCSLPQAYSTLSEGSHTFQVKAIDAVGNSSTATRTWTVDTVAPNVSIDSGPSGAVSGTSASFTFSSNDQGATFECSLDGDPFTSCSSPKSYINLADGSHTFSVRATDTAGNSDPIPASTTWTVDAVAPDTTIDYGPSETINVAEATFAFSSEAGATFECRLDGAAYSACTSPLSYTNLSNGSHAFDVRATDGAGNVGATLASRTFRVDVPPPPDTTPPETTIDSGPSGTVSTSSAEFSFSASEDGSTFECSLDGGTFGACTSPKSYSGLSEGSHTLQAKATDQAGNTDASPASRTWTVDTTSPETTIDIGSADGGTLSNGDVSFTFSSSEAGSTLECSLDGSAFEPCSSPKEYADLSEGSHTFEVRATDAAGNTDASPASTTWTVDITAPETMIDYGPSETINVAEATFAFSSEAGATFECRLDGAAYSACTPPQSYTNLSNGSHTFEVRAKDAANNVDATPASDTFTIDTNAPSAPTISAPATDGTTDTDGDLRFTFSGAEGGGTFECSLDTGTASYSACTSQKDYNDQADGSYTFRVRQVDAAGNIGTAAMRSISVDVPAPDPYVGIRYNKQVGVQLFDTTTATATTMQNTYADYCTDATSTDCHGADDSTDFVVRTTLKWEVALVNENNTPTLTQMRDPNWSGYVWNNPSNANYAEVTESLNMLGATCVTNDKCKVALNVTTGATGGANAPEFMVTNGYAWHGAGASHKNVRVKWYNTTARQYVENFMFALLSHYDDPDITSIRLDEYFPGSTPPSDWTSSGGQDAYEDGYFTFMGNVLADAPTDANGDRVAIYQTNPLGNADAFTQTQISNMMLGLGASDPYMFEHPANGVTLRTGLHGEVPMSAPLDAPNITAGDLTTYDGTANPWGYANNHQESITVAQIAWYYGHCGPLPTDQEFIAKPGEPSKQFVAAMDQFGPGGSDHSANCSAATDDWGGVPWED